jgi:SpoVK/Ycf46/Vps4 family AAA+-type ATPase
MKMNLFKLSKTEQPSPKKEFQNTIPFKDMVILDHLEVIMEISRKYGIDRCYPRAKKHFDYITEKLALNPIQAVLFSHFLGKGDETHIQISEIAESIQINKIRIVKYMNECEELERRKLLRCSRDDDSVTYRIPGIVLDSLRQNSAYQPENHSNLSITEFFAALERMFSEREKKELSYTNMKTELIELINENMQLLFCKKIMSYNLSDEDLVLLVCFCHLAGNNSDDNIGIHDLDFLYESKSNTKYVKRNLSSGDHTLIHIKLIMHNNSNGFINPESWKVTDMAKKDLMSELNLSMNKNFKKNMILADSIKSKKMFYNEQEKKDIETLTNLLREENYIKVLERLDGKGMRKGFACLFSGPPGTGKTETAYQIARETGRNILMVDISETKSMWYGESEKKIKEIFDTYHSAVENSTIAPILLFNEADAIIGRRKEISDANPSIDQTENTIQNIILQEMETMNGILIATTNLTQNMDRAFERRFLYKITFQKPGTESRMGIWQSLLPELSESSVRELSKKFDLSGGQIENIARKNEVDAILSGDAFSVDTLERHCKDEHQNGINTAKRIGFGNE